MPIYRDDQPWDYNKDGDKGFKRGYPKELKLTKDVQFILEDSFKHFKVMKAAVGAPGGKKVESWPASFFIESSYNWYNPATQTTHVIQYVSKVNANGGGKNKTVSKYMPLVIDFIKGRLKCPKKDIDLYLFLMNHPENRSNKLYYNPDGTENQKTMQEANYKFTFHEKNEVKDNERKNKLEKLRYEAQGKIYNGLTNVEKRELYASYNNPDSDDEAMDKIDLFLLEEAKADPVAFMSKIDNADVQMKALITRAVEFNVIRFNKNSRIWQFVNNEQGSICSVIRGKDEYASIVIFLRDNDVTHEIENTIREALKVAIKDADD